MRFLATTLLAASVLLGCASTPPTPVSPDQHLATASEPLFLPFSYGLENGPEGLKCGPPWEGGRCNIPKNRTFKVAVFYTTCPTWYHQKLTTVLQWAQEQTQLYGWNLQVVGMAEANYFIGCVNGDTAISYFDPLDTKCQDTQFGKLCKYEGGVIGINTGKIEDRNSWRNATDRQRRKWAHNAIKHELLHMLGHGHFIGGQDGTRIMAQWFPADITTPVWNEDLDMDPIEAAAMDCFNPAGSTNDLCGD